MEPVLCARTVSTIAASFRCARIIWSIPSPARRRRDGRRARQENRVGLVRERFFTPRLRFATYDELNAWRLDKCLLWAKAHAHPERPDLAIFEVFEQERPILIPYRGRFDGFHAPPASVSKTCLVRFDNNKYSVSASAVGRPVDVHAMPIGS